jgi:hypothetical protein
MDDLVALGCGRDLRPGLKLANQDKDVARLVGQADEKAVAVAIKTS